jgi:hypothetical protein
VSSVKNEALFEITHSFLLYYPILLVLVPVAQRKGCLAGTDSVEVTVVVFETGFQDRDPAYDGEDPYYGWELQVVFVSTS